MIIDWYRKGQVYGDTSYHNIMQDHYNFKGELEKHNVTDEELVKIISFFKSLPLTKDLYINFSNLEVLFFFFFFIIINPLFFLLL